MADSKKGFLAKSLRKKAGRVTEQVRQNIGKADKTVDEQFDEYVTNFNKQQVVAAKLHKELKNYLLCVKSIQLASKSFYDTLQEVHEPEWLGHENLKAASESLSLLWNDFYQKMNDQVFMPLTSYENQFPDIKNKIAKRGRKLVDYDSARHHLDSVTTNKKKDDQKDMQKLLKAQEQLNDSKKHYDDIHCELTEELPALYDSRISFYVSNFQTVFSAEAIFHSETSKINNQLSVLMDKLAEESAKGTYNTRSSLRARSSVSSNASSTVNKASSTASDMAKSGAKNEDKAPTAEGSLADHYEVAVPDEEKASTLSSWHSTHSGGSGDCIKETDTATTNGETQLTKSPTGDTYEPVDVGAQLPDKNDDANKPDPKNPFEDDEDEEPEPSETDKPTAEPAAPTVEDVPGTLYKVCATHKYDGEDEDELSFEAGEMICVVPYDDPEEQDEGWLMGVMLSSKAKGVFPANFTKPL